VILEISWQHPQQHRGCIEKQPRFVLWACGRMEYLPVSS